MSIPAQRFLFITGTARSGTTTIADFLRLDRRIVMGRERYAWRLRERREFAPSLFEKRRFCLDYRADDSHHQSLDAYYREAADYFDDAAFVGDKLPALALQYDALDTGFADSKVIFMLREPTAVAMSYERRAEETRELQRQGEAIFRKWPPDRGWQAGMEEWNRSMQETARALESRDIFVLDYERLYRDLSQLEQLYAFLGLPLDGLLAAVWVENGQARQEIEREREGEGVPIDIATGIKANADFDSYHALRHRAP